MFQKPCEWCGTQFLARRTIDIYCSPGCRQNGSAEKARRRTAEWRKANPERAKQAVAEWRKANPERAKQSVKAWHKDNPERRSKHRADWRKSNAEAVKKSKAEWFKDNPDKSLIYSHRRRARKVANGGSLTSTEWQTLKSYYNHRCLCCGGVEPEVELTVDHIIPISLGGANNISNIQPLCRTCNLSKGTKIIDFRPR